MSTINHVLSLLVGEIESVLPDLEESVSPLVLARIKRSHAQIEGLRTAGAEGVGEMIEAAHELGSTLMELAVQPGSPGHHLMRFWHGVSPGLTLPRV